MPFRTEQEAFWAGEFGTEYIDRNSDPSIIASNLNLFSKALHSAHEVNSCVEFGANVGMNLKALKLLYPDIDAHAIEINADAVRELESLIPKQNIINQSILEFEPSTKFDLTLIKGVLIHINPEQLPLVYKSLVASCDRYILVAEYYNPVPVAIPYRGHNDRLFKRDFAGEIMDRHPEMKLIDYGFGYHRDPDFPVDDISWFLLEKK